MKMKNYKYLAISLLTVVVGILSSCTDGNDWEYDSSKAKVLQTKIPSVSKVTGEAALLVTVEAFGCSSIEYQASTTPDFTENLVTQIENSLSCKLTGLKGYENYYVRVRGLKDGFQPSKWMNYASGDAEGTLKTIMTNGVQLINEVDPAHITTSSIGISWVIEKDGKTYNPTKVSATYYDGSEEVVTFHDLSAEAKADQSFVFEDLLNSTKYQLRLYQDFGDGSDECIGFIEAKTQMAPPKADYTYTLPFTATVIDQAMINMIAQEAKTARGSEDDYEATIIVPQGMSVQVKEGTTYVSIPAGMTLNFFGNGEEDARATLIFPYRIDIPGRHTAMRFQNLNLVGNPDNKANELYLFNQSGTATNTSTISITSCKLTNFGRSILRLQSSGGGTVSNFIADDCIFQDLGFTGAYPIIYNQSANGGIENVEITNSTFDTCTDYVIRQNNTSGGAFKTIKFSDCTFYNSIGNGKYWIDNSVNFDADITITNIIVGKLYLGSGTVGGKGIRAKGSNIYDYTTFDGYYQLSDVVWGGNKIDAGGSNWPGTFKSKYSTEEMFTNPDGHDFTLKHYLDAGDPRWKIEDSGDDDGGDE